MPQVLKANGELQEFSEEKVLASIRRAGIPRHLQEQVLHQIKQKLYDRIPTSEIYSDIIDSLGKSSSPYAKSAYSLKQAIMLLGPTGYPFEDFIAVVLHAHGYHTRIRQILRGSCVNHEIDVIAEKKGRSVMVEAKFHNNPGVRSDLHVVLYTKARFEDIKVRHKLTEPWLVTNTKVTTDAITYAECVGMRIVSWQYPSGQSLRDLIERFRLHPITILTSLTTEQKMKLLMSHIVVCRDILSNPLLLDMLQLNVQEEQRVLDEITYICHPQPPHKHHV